jgi:histidinol-phosphate aminotransferase
MSVENLARPEIAALSGYSSSNPGSATIRLNANEAFCSPWADTDVAILNRYPELRPNSLRQQLASLYDLSEQNLLATRGSSEAIDLLIRTFCRAYQDEVLITPPTFEMYKVYADIQGANVISVPLQQQKDFALAIDAVLQACTPNTKIVFLGSPNNPTGTVINQQDILDICAARKEQSVVVIDEAYIEFSDCNSMVSDVADVDNLVVLRTLSKAFALAGARCGAVIGTEIVISILGRVLSPYSFATPVVQRITTALGSGQMENAKRLIDEIVAQRELMLEKLKELRITDTVWPSQGNFLLAKFHNLARVRKRLEMERIQIREFLGDTELEGCARITIGSAEENDCLIRALASLGAAHD